LYGMPVFIFLSPTTLSMFDIGVLDQFAHSLPTATIQGTVLVTYLDRFICATVVGSNRRHGLEVGGAFTVNWKSMVAFR